jgi:hypothetical protein
MDQERFHPQGEHAKGILSHPWAQCTELLKSKLKQSGDWDQVSTVYDLLGLTRLIKSIVFKFDDQKFLPVSLHQAKQNFYIMRQGQMTNAEYLEKFNNLVDIASSYNGDILDPAVLEYCRLKLHPGTVIANQNIAEMLIVRQTASDLCLATAFILQCDRRRFGKLLEELENDFTKGHNNYPSDMVKAYQLLNEARYLATHQPLVLLNSMLFVHFVSLLFGNSPSFVPKRNLSLKPFFGK